MAPRTSLLLILGLLLIACPSDDDDTAGPDDDDAVGDDDTIDDDDSLDDDDSADDDDAGDDDDLDDDDAGDDDAGDDDDAVAPCPQEATEPNDAGAWAVPIADGDSIAGYAVDLTDVDLFAASACPGADLELVWTPVDAADAATLVLSDDAGEELDRREAAAGAQTFALSDAPHAGYLLSVSEPVDGCVEYDLAVSLDLSGCAPECMADSHEEDDFPGVTTGIATSSVDHLGMTAVGADADHFPFVGCPGEEVALTLSWDESLGEPQVMIVNAFGFDVAGELIPARSEVDLAWTPDDAGLYWVQVAASAGECVPYDLSMTLDSSSCAATCIDDLFEPNDTTSDAVLLADGDQLGGLAVLAGSEDHWSVELCEGAEVTMDLVHDAAAGIASELLDASGAPLTATTPTATGATVSWTAAAEEVVDLAVSIGADCAWYSLQVSVDESGCPPPACVPDVFEDDDQAALANQVVNYDWLPGLTGEPGDEDWFFTLLCAGAIITVTVDETGGDPVDLEVMDIGQNPVGTISATATGWEGTWENLSGGTTFARVLSDGPTCSDYDIGFAIDESACCTLDAQEPDDDLASATLVPGSASYSGSATTTDDDWYAVELCAGAGLTIDLYADWPNANLDLYLVDETGGALAQSTNFGAADTVDWTSSAEETVHARVTSVWGDCSAYSIDFDVGGCGDDDDSAIDDDDSAMDDDDSAIDDDDSAVDDDDSAIDDDASAIDDDHSAADDDDSAADDDDSAR